MPVLADQDKKIRNAIKAFWGVKDEAVNAQIARGIEDLGARRSITSGKHLDAFVPIFADIASAHKIKDLKFFAGRVSTLPGFFRPTKEWDLIITQRGVLLAVFEMKSIGSSFGKNMNNRTEEAVGSSHDLLTAYREGAFGKDTPKPFIGWAMIMNECEESTMARRTSERHFKVDSKFRGASYAARCDLLCEKLVHENMYSAAALMLTAEHEGRENGEYRHLSEGASIKRFLATFHGHMATIAASS